MEKLIVIGIASYSLLMLPTWLEAFVIDPYVFWDRGKDDKPASTYIRGVLIILVSVMPDFVFHYGHWYWALIISGMFHVIVFAYLVNIKLNREPSYLGSGTYDTWIKGIPVWVRLLVSGALLIAAIILFELTKY